jgi:hypothetical protein
MKANREILETELEKYESQLKGFKSYIKELNDMTAKLGTDREQFEQDLIEAENNVTFYEGEVQRVKKELGKYGGTGYEKGAPDAVLPRTVKQGIGSFLFSSVSFVAGAILGSKMKAKRTGQDAPVDKEKGD